MVLFGATGFTGRLVAEYLARNAGSEVRWAIAGRDARRLQEVEAAIRQIAPDCAPVGVIQADNRDWASLALMANKARVVLTTVGPYVDGGDKLVRACVTSGTDYVDITGEPEFVDSVIEQYDGPARDRGVRIVNCCGFDSIPHDLGVLFTMRHLPADRPVRIEGFVKMRGTYSGGTWRSAVKAMSNLRGTLRDKASRPPPAPGSQDDHRQIHALGPHIRYEPKVEGWVLPLPTIDPDVILRSARALDSYGPDFAYGHYVQTSRLKHAARLLAGAGAMVALAQFRPTRAWLLSRSSAGQGPSREQMAEGWFQVTFVARGGDREVITRVSGGDPGYGETSKMASEAALCLALDRDRLPDRAGVLTPAVALGEPLIERLQKAGMRFEILAGA